MRQVVGNLQIVIFYALGAIFILFALSYGWDELEDNTGYQYIIAVFFGVSVVWLLLELFRFINNATTLSGMYPVLINLVGLGLCVGYLMNVEEGRAKPVMAQPSDVDTVTISGDTLLAIQKGDTIFYKIGNRVLIDKKDALQR
ncbi:hypothetical protein [Pontibacter anaerobius]|uniref:NfeD-like C-terminal domain-containing protein n=1 Tax=Pontibacter anaerobius TaxID=2993940 RepID=A0ABT3RJM3_9BACT|nr:hypothetical protein [Pontibacter anaerobius]MCX2741765.1 hypothetical protein [Pontibacter anaerobius]